MIHDSRVLQDDFLPGEVVHRESEIQSLAHTLEPLMDDEPAEDSFIFGPTGAGKTCISQHTLDQLEQEAFDFRHTYINCWENYNRFRVLYKALEGIGETLDIHRQSTPKDELLSRLRGADSRPYILILDEVDQLEDKRVLYDLHQMPHITMIMIANRESDVFAHMDDRVHSRLAGVPRMKFGKYSLNALVDILQDRTEWGLDPGSVSQERLEQIADIAAGDARIAIGILRNAARRAEEQREDTITPDLVEDAAPVAREEHRKKTIDQLNPHQQALYEVIDDAGEIAPRELYDAYNEKMENPKSERTLRKYLQKMEHYNLVVAQGEKRGRTYRAATE